MVRTNCHPSVHQWLLLSCYHESCNSSLISRFQCHTFNVFARCIYQVGLKASTSSPLISRSSHTRAHFPNSTNGSMVDNSFEIKRWVPKITARCIYTINSHWMSSWYGAVWYRKPCNFLLYFRPSCRSDRLKVIKTPATLHIINYALSLCEWHRSPKSIWSSMVGQVTRSGHRNFLLPQFGQWNHQKAL